MDVQLDLLAHVGQGAEAGQAPGDANPPAHQGHHDARDLCSAQHRQVQRDSDGAHRVRWAQSRIPADACAQRDLPHLQGLLLKRKAALLQATHGQRICWELLRAIDKGVARARDTEVVDALKRIKEYGLAKFTQEPDKSEEI